MSGRDTMDIPYFINNALEISLESINSNNITTDKGNKSFAGPLMKNTCDHYIDFYGLVSDSQTFRCLKRFQYTRGH